MTNTSYNQTYNIVSGVRGRWWSFDDEVDDTLGQDEYLIYSYDVGGGVWYTILNDKSTATWSVVETNVDPSTWSNGTTINGSNVESFTSNTYELDPEGYRRPLSSDSNVTYSGGTLTSVNDWYVGTAVSNGGTQSAYISNDGGTTHEYNNDETQLCHIFKDFTTPADISNGVTLDFDWIAYGEPSIYDYLRVFIAPLTESPTAGTQINSSYNIIGSTGRYLGSSSWTSESEDISSLLAANTTYRLIFQWRNDGSSGFNPPAAVDNIDIYLYV